MEHFGVTDPRLLQPVGFERSCSQVSSPVPVSSCTGRTSMYIPPPPENGVESR